MEVKNMEFEQMMEYYNMNGDLVVLVWDGIDGYVFINYRNQKSTFYNDLKNNLVYIIDYLVTDKVRTIIDIDLMLLKVIIEDIDCSNYYDNPEKLLKKLMEYVEDNKIDLNNIWG
jgi:hypothetical protein